MLEIDGGMLGVSESEGGNAGVPDVSPMGGKVLDESSASFGNAYDVEFGVLGNIVWIGEDAMKDIG